MRLERYQDLSGKGGVTAFKIFKDAIILQFENKYLYLYDYIRPGRDHVERMKGLAKQGRGLTTYVNQNVRDNYRKKL